MSSFGTRYVMNTALLSSLLLGGVGLAHATSSLPDPEDACDGSVVTDTSTAFKIFPSGAKVANLYKFFGKVPRHVIIQNPGYQMDLIGAISGTLTVQCEILKPNGDTVIRPYNNGFNPNTDSAFIWFNGAGPVGEDGVKAGSNRRCDRIVSVFTRMDTTVDPTEAASILNGESETTPLPGFPEFQPFRLSVRGCDNFGPIPDPIPE